MKIKKLKYWNPISRIISLLETINGKVDRIMSSEQELQDALDGIKDDITKVAARIQSLLDQIAQLQAGQPVSQAQLDALTTEAAAIKAALDPLTA